MLQGKMVKIRFRRNFAEQKLWVFVGRVREFTDHWIQVEGKAIISLPLYIDEEPRMIVIPRDNIAHIRILPETVNLDHLSVEKQGMRRFLRIEGAPDTSVGEEI